MHHFLITYRKEDSSDYNEELVFCSTMRGAESHAELTLKGQATDPKIYSSDGWYKHQIRILETREANAWKSRKRAAEKAARKIAEAEGRTK